MQVSTSSVVINCRAFHSGEAAAEERKQARKFRRCTRNAVSRGLQSYFEDDRLGGLCGCWAHDVDMNHFQAIHLFSLDESRLLSAYQDTEHVYTYASTRCADGSRIMGPRGYKPHSQLLHRNRWKQCLASLLEKDGLPECFDLLGAQRSGQQSSELIGVRQWI